MVISGIYHSNKHINKHGDVKHMTPHELMIKTNHHLIKGGKLTAMQKENIVRQFLDARNNEINVQNFMNGDKTSNNIFTYGR